MRKTILAAATTLSVGVVQADTLHFPYFVQAPELGLTSAVSVMTQRPGAGIGDPNLFALNFTYIYKEAGADREEPCNKVDNFVQQSSNDLTTWILTDPDPLFEPPTSYNLLTPVGGPIEGQLVVYQNDEDLPDPDAPSGRKGELAGEIVYLTAANEVPAFGSMRAINNPNSYDPNDLAATGFGSANSLMNRIAEDAAPSIIAHPGIDTTWFIAVSRDGMATQGDNSVPDLAVELSLAFYNSDGQLVPGLYADRQENIFSTNKRFVVNCFGRVTLADMLNGPELAKVLAEGLYARLTITDYDPNDEFDNVAIDPEEEPEFPIDIIINPDGNGRPNKSIYVYKIEDLGDTLVTSENRIDF